MADGWRTLSMAAHEAVKALTTPSDTWTSEPLRVLVVDDMGEFAGLIASYLWCKGLMTCVATSAEEAIRCISDWVPDILLADVQMPDGGAPRILTWLEGHVRRPVVILMTGAELPWACKALRAGLAYAVLHKPFSLQLLTEVLAGAYEATRRRYQLLR